MSVKAKINGEWITHGDNSAGAVFYNGKQELTTSEQEQARKNIGTTQVQLITWEADD